MPRLRASPQLGADFARTPVASLPPAPTITQTLDHLSRDNNSPLDAQAPAPSPILPDAAPTPDLLQPDTHSVHKSRPEPQVTPNISSSGIEPCMTLETITFPPSQTLVPFKYLAKSQPRIRVLHHPAWQRDFGKDKESASTEPRERPEKDISRELQNTTIKTPAGGSSSTTKGPPMATRAHSAPQPTQPRAEMHGFRTFATPVETTSTPATPILAPTITARPSLGLTNEALSMFQVLFLSLFLLGLLLTSVVLFLVNFPPSAGSWVAAPWLRTRRWFQGLARTAPRILRQLRRVDARRGGGYKVLESTAEGVEEPGSGMDEGDGVLDRGTRTSAGLSSPSSAVELVSSPRFSPGHGLRYRRSPRVEQAARFEGIAEHDSPPLLSPTLTDPENYLVWLLAARQNADVESGTSPLDEVSLISPSAVDALGGGDGWLAWVANGVDRGADKSAEMMHRHVERGGAEEGLLLPVRGEEREGSAAGWRAREWEDGRSD